MRTRNCETAYRRNYDHVTPLLRDVHTGSQFPFESSSRSVCWSTSCFVGQRLGICATIVRRRILPLRSTDKCDLLVRRMKTRFGDRAFSAAGTNFLLLCVQPIQSIHLKLYLRPTCSATHIPLLVDCKAPLYSGMAVLRRQL